MLRITTQTSRDSTVLLKLEGKLLGPWLAELEHSIDRARCGGSGLMLDLSDLTFADAAGARLLAGLIRQGAGVSACSGYIAALLHVEES